MLRLSSSFAGLKGLQIEGGRNGTVHTDHLKEKKLLEV